MSDNQLQTCASTERSRRYRRRRHAGTRCMDRSEHRIGRRLPQRFITGADAPPGKPAARCLSMAPLPHAEDTFTPTDRPRRSDESKLKSELRVECQQETWLQNGPQAAKGRGFGRVTDAECTASRLQFRCATCTLGLSWQRGIWRRQTATRRVRLSWRSSLFCRTARALMRQFAVLAPLKRRRLRKEELRDTVARSLTVRTAARGGDEYHSRRTFFVDGAVQTSP